MKKRQSNEEGSLALKIILINIIVLVAVFLMAAIIQNL
ncbi:hypothetical protein SAMN05421741_1418 [Paenimyroides ummariense]|uniref:Uncharacterized protein n=1 Tax=Paenimyroides ummariense TaxID=913024 RepID=A0A1I5GGB1_9FLAO|nr:hypothetical protein SAMN05421741_1418 [Paenimyroides ummariense]